MTTSSGVADSTRDVVVGEHGDRRGGTRRRSRPVDGVVGVATPAAIGHGVAVPTRP